MFSKKNNDFSRRVVSSILTCFFVRGRRWQVGLSRLQNLQSFEQGLITPVFPKGDAANLKGCALLPPAPFVHLHICELEPAEMPKSLNKDIAKQNRLQMQSVSFLVSCCYFVSIVFSLFWDLGLASVVK